MLVHFDRFGRRRNTFRRRGRQEEEIEEGNAIDIEEDVAEEDEEGLGDDDADDNSLMMDEMLADAIEEEAFMEALDEIAEDNEKREVDGDGVPDWCNPVKPMGAWLNFKKMKLWCADRGFTDFGPYGGVPKMEEAVDKEPATQDQDLV